MEQRSRQQITIIQKYYRLLVLRSSRLEQVAITRWKGHTRFTHEHLMVKLESKYCETYDEMITVKHLLLDCKLYTALSINMDYPKIWNILWDQIQQNQIIEFLKDAQLIDKIWVIIINIYFIYYICISHCKLCDISHCELKIKKGLWFSPPLIWLTKLAMTSA